MKQILRDFGYSEEREEERAEQSRYETKHNGDQEPSQFHAKRISATMKTLELTQTERTCQEFVEKNNEPVADALSRLLQSKRFILVGESHADESEPIRYAVAHALEKLKEGGLTHIALEAVSSNQSIVDSLDFTNPQIRETLKEQKVGGSEWSEGNFEILITAKLLGLKVVLINHNDGRSHSMRDNARWQNERDARMLETIQQHTDDKSKVLVFIGSDHVHKKPVKAYADGEIISLGMRLSEEFGDENTTSIRYVGESGNFDNLLSHESHTPTPQKISKGENRVVVIPDEGPVKGDSRVSAADYIITII